MLGWWIVVQVASVFAGEDSDVAWWAHIGGLAAGAILVVFMRQKGVPLFAAVGPRVAPDAPLSPPIPFGASEPPFQKGPWG